MPRGAKFSTREKAEKAAQKRGMPLYEIKEAGGAFYLFERFEESGLSLKALAEATAEPEEDDVDPLFGVGHKSAGHASYLLKRAGLNPDDYTLRRDDEMKWWITEREKGEPALVLHGPHKRELEEDRAFKAPNTLEANRAHSTVEKPVARVHRICAEMVGAPRKEVIARCVAEGVNIHTAKTQYQVWNKRQRQNRG